MKGSRSTCLLCRHLLATSGGLRSSQRQTQAVSFSTTAASKTDNPDITTTRTSNEPFPTKSTNPQSKPYTFRKVLEKERPEKPERQRSHNKPRKAPPKNSARVDALFQQIVREQTATKDALPTTTPTNPNLDLPLVQAIGKLERMVDRGDSIVDAYAYLKTDIYPMLQEPDITVPRVFHRTVSRLLENVVAAKKDAMRSPTLPTVADMFRIYADIGEMRPQRWAMLVGELVKSIVELEPSTAEQDPATTNEKLINHDTMLADLVESWKIFSLPKVVPVTANNEVTDGFWFPSVDKASLRKFSDKGNFPAALSGVFPQYPANQVGAPVAVLAIATYALLLDPQRSHPYIRQSATRFIAKIAYLITFVNFRDAALRREVLNHFPELEPYVMSQWPVIKEQLKYKIKSIVTPNAQTQTDETPPSTSSGRFNPSYIGDRLRQAYTQTRNVGEVNELWREFIGSTTEIPPERVTQLQKCSDLFDTFIYARMAMNQPDKAIEALGTLRKVGLKPTTKTWNSMLDGCKKARNVNAIKNVWAKLASSGMKLDMMLWTTRVSGLIESGDVKGGIEALQEMTKLWNQRSKHNKTIAVKPTIEPVNAALVGLIRQDQVSLAENLLVWAGQQGIEPDIYTFNTLLRRLVRDGRDKEVRKLFNVMDQAGVRADEATFTIILDEAFSKIAPDDVEEQARTVTRVLHEMQAVGLEVNLQTYGKMIYNLLRLGDRARNAVKTVLAHLWAQDLELSPHIYTMIVEHYFFGRPDDPDLDAVEALLQRRNLLLDRDDLDPVFHDRLVRGFSMAGRSDRALEIYWKLSKAGVVVILTTQLELLHALVRDGRVEDAKAMVANTKSMFEDKHRGLENVETAGFWGHLFWRVAERHGLYVRDAPSRGAVAGEES